MTAPALSYNIEAEQATISAALINPAAAILVASWLTPAMFYDARYGCVWGAWLAVNDAGGVPNLIGVRDELRRRGELERIGGFDALLTLTDMPMGLVSTAIEDYARRVEACAIDRELLQASRTIAQIAQDEARTTAQKLGDAQQAVSAVQMRGDQRGLVHIGADTAALKERLDAVQAGKPMPTGTRTGFRDLDELLGGGFQRSDLIILAARPGVGKSSFWTSMAFNIANEPEDGRARDVLGFSLEMSRGQNSERLLSMITHIDTARLRTSTLRKDEVGPYLFGLDTLKALPIFIDETPSVSVAYVRNQVYRHIAERGVPSIVVVDYVQLMSAPGFKPDNRVGIVSAISQGLKALAKEINIPVLALAQLSRSVESRESKVPMLSDLRESGSLEQDADVVIFIYRDELYDTTTDKKGIAELHIAKHRNGPIGVIPMRFDPATTRFDTLSYRSMEGY